MEPKLTLDDLLKMSNRKRKQVIFNAHPIDLDAIEGKMYRGIDLRPSLDNEQNPGGRRSGKPCP